MSVRLLAIANDQDILSERFDHFEMKLERRLTSAEAYAQANIIVDALGELPTRDKFTLEVEISDDALTISDPSESSRMTEHIASYHEDGDSIIFRIEIIKEVVQQHLSVYSPTAFGAYLDSMPLSDALSALARRFQEQLIFECYSDTPKSGSATLRFVKAGDAPPEVGVSLAWRSRALALLEDNTYRTGNTGTLIPRDFAVTQPIGVPTLDAFMARAGAVLAAMFLSNMSDLRENQLVYRITGYKLIGGTVSNLANLVDDAATFQQIADWAYGAEGNSDKIGLARNVISLCVQSLEDVPSHSEIWDAIQSNYQIYLKENIATYLEVRNKLAELLAESMHKTHSLVEKLLDSIRNGVFVVLTFLLTVVVVNGLKDAGVQAIFSIEYFTIVLTLLVLSSFGIWASCRDARSRFDQSATATSQLLRRMYAHVMIATEIEEHVKPTINENREYLDRQAKKYFKFWLIFAGLVAFAFLAGHCAFAKIGDLSNPTYKAINITTPTPEHHQRQHTSQQNAPAVLDQAPDSIDNTLPRNNSKDSTPQAQSSEPRVQIDKNRDHDNEVTLSKSEGSNDLPRTESNASADHIPEDRVGPTSKANQR